MGMRTDARIRTWQERARLEPACGAQGEVLEEISRTAYKLIRTVELEQSGIRDGDGAWRGSDPLDSQIWDLQRLLSTYFGRAESGEDVSSVVGSIDDIGM